MTDTTTGATTDEAKRWAQKYRSTGKSVVLTTVADKSIAEESRERLKDLCNYMEMCLLGHVVGTGPFVIDAWRFKDEAVSLRKFLDGPSLPTGVTQ
jgi:hypothetical protein